MVALRSMCMLLVVATERRLIRIPRDLADRIDRVRGDVPRDRWIRRELERALGSRPDEVSVARASSRASEETYVLPKIARRS